jgi:hypothetical protein
MNRTGCAIFVLLIALRVDAQELVANGNFDNALDGWIVTGDGEAVHETDDVDDNPVSGSVQVTNLQPDAGSRVVPLRQCVGVAGGGTYLVGASSRIPAGQGNGKLVLSVGIHRSADCSSGISGGFGRSLPTGDAWSPTALIQSIASDTQSLLISLGVDKTAAGGSFGGQVDAITLERLPQIFDDGFE